MKLKVNGNIEEKQLTGDSIGTENINNKKYINRRTYLRKSYTSILLIAFMSLVLIYVPCLTTYAGDINDNEATIIAVANGTFKYNGKTYRAKSEYISELYSFLADDDTDLTAEQAHEAIDYMFSNVKEGIDSGYIYEVGGNKNNTDANNSDKNNSSNSNVSNSNDSNNSTNKNDGSDKTYDLDSNEDQNPIVLNNGKDSKEGAKDASDKEVAELFSKMDENQKLRDRIRNVASDTDATIIVDDSSITITTKDSNYKLYKDSRIIPKNLTMFLMIIGAVALVINICLATVLFAKGCMRFKKQEKAKPKKGHRHRRKVRKFCRNIMTVTSAICISLVCLIMALAIGVFNSNKVVQNIQTSGYFRYAYTEYVTEQTDACESYDSYDNFIVQEKIAISKTLAGTGTPDGTAISDRSIAPYIKRVQLDVKTDLKISMILSVAAILIASICNIFMDLRRDRGVKSLAISVSVSTVVTFASAIILNMLHIESRFFVEPGYLYSFLGDQMNWIIKVFVIIGLFSTAIAASLVGLYQSMRIERQ